MVGTGKSAHTLDMRRFAPPEIMPISCWCYHAIPMQIDRDNITQLLLRWNDGDQAALDQMLPLIRRELNQIAIRHLARERRDQTMQPSSLVQEAFLRLLPGVDISWQNRTHFFAVASRVMRRVLVDHARARNRIKRGASPVRVQLEAAPALSTAQVDMIVAVDLALERLKSLDERKSRVFEMRFFGGLEVEETAAALGVSTLTVIRDWKFAIAWLRRELGSGVSDNGALETS
jgi:RNA polymerase sigma-70 factor, ECF subfamily